jgi:hypothetical protein
MGLSLVVAMFVQWLTTGAGILMAYLTPTVGLGCRSGSYMIYGSAGTMVLLLMVFSMICSNEAMKIYQREHAANPNVDFSHGYRRGRWHGFVCFMAVSSRFLGKTLAVGNTIWLLLSSLFEYIGLYSNCLCKSCVFGLGSKAWVVLFKTDPDFKQVASSAWVSGVIMSTLGAILIGLFFKAGSLYERRG